MLLVDTSVVIDYTRSADAAMLAIFQAEGAAITGIIRAEVLHGAGDLRRKKETGTCQEPFMMWL